MLLTIRKGVEYQLTPIHSLDKATATPCPWAIVIVMMRPIRPFHHVLSLSHTHMSIYLIHQVASALSWVPLEEHSVSQLRVKYSVYLLFTLQVKFELILSEGDDEIKVLKKCYFRTHSETELLKVKPEKSWCSFCFIFALYQFVCFCLNDTDPLLMIMKVDEWAQEVWLRRSNRYV